MENYFEYIQDYLDEILSPEDRHLFELELERNAALREETVHQRALRDTIAKQLNAAAGLPALKETLQRTSKSYFAAPRQKKGRLITWLIPAAAAACLLIAFNFFGRFATDFDELPDMSLSITRSGAQDAAYQDAATAFNAGKYKESADLLIQLVAGDSTVARYQFHLGLSYLGQQDYGAAVKTLHSVADGTSVFADDARYFTAVALWRLGKDTEAVVYAERVSEESHYHDKAIKLLGKLK